MVHCENFIYTTALIGNKSGYQIIAKSKNITEDIQKELGGYYYPVGIDSNQFKESNSLLSLQNDKIAFSMIKNIGIGFDGRENTLYNHTIILDRQQFEILNYDSRILSSYFIQEPKAIKLDQIDIKEKKIEPAWDYIEKIPRNIVETVFDQIFSKKKIAIEGIDDINLIPNIISFLPKSMKIIPFSTLISQPKKQSRFRIIQLSENNELTSNTDYVEIDVSELMPFYKNDNDRVFERSIKIFVEILRSKNIKSLEFIQNEFEEIKTDDFKNKLKLITYYEQIRNESNKDKCEKFAKDILKLLDYFDEEITIKYLLKIKEFLHEDDYRKYLKQLELDQITTKFKYKPINFQNIDEMLRSLNDWSYESWDNVFSRIIKQNIERIKENGTDILIDGRTSLKEVILDNFIRNKELHKNILEVFGDKSKLDTYYQKTYFEHIIEKIAKKDHNLTIELLKKSIFDLNNDYDSRHYKNILKSILHNNEFIEKTEPELILKLINEIFLRIKKIIEYKPTSGTTGTTNSNLQELTRIMKGFVEHLGYLENQKLDNQLKNEVLKQKDELKEFLEKHKPKSTLSSLLDW